MGGKQYVECTVTQVSAWHRVVALRQEVVEFERGGVCV